MFNKLYHHIGFIRFLVNLCKFKNLHIHPTTTIGFNGQLTLPKSVKISQGTRIEMNSDSKLVLGENVKLCQRVHLYPQGGTISIATNTSIQDDCRIYGQVSVGNNCLFAPNVFASSSSHLFSKEPTAPMHYQEAKYSSPQAPITIGDDCWIGINTYIAPGVTIGAGCIIGANSSVTKNIGPYSIAVGSPARVIKSRIDFVPPKLLEAINKNNWPYFYSGFTKQDNSVTSIGDFTLALESSNTLPKKLDLEFISPSSGLLIYLNQSLQIEQGLNKLTININELGPFFNFKSTATLKHHRAELK